MRLYVPLTLAEFDQLRDVAAAERRPLRDQAAVLLAKALKCHERAQRAARTPRTAASAPEAAHAQSA
jgi:hypothetical protein